MISHSGGKYKLWDKPVFDALKKTQSIYEASTYLVAPGAASGNFWHDLSSSEMNGLLI
jgi:hypothetical protein